MLVGTPLVGADRAPGGGFVVRTPRERIEAELVVNAAGLYADECRPSAAESRSGSTRAAASTPSSRRARGTS